MEGHTTTVYGPVASWRFGWSLGVDLILSTSVCSLNCVYCQLGPIQERTNERREFLPTERVLADLEAHEWQRSEIVIRHGWLRWSNWLGIWVFDFARPRCWMGGPPLLRPGHWVG